MKIGVVGFGIAGLMMTEALQIRGHSVVVFDDVSGHSSSRVSAGLINPITGRIFAKSWMYEDLESRFVSIYRRLEHRLEASFLEKRRFLRTIQNQMQQDKVKLRRSQADHADFIGKICKEELPFKTEKPVVEIKNGYQVRVWELIQTYKSKLPQNVILRPEKFSFDDLVLSDPEKVQHKEETFDVIVFCEGAAVKQNPFFKDLPVAPYRGQILQVHVEELSFEDVFKCGVTIAPWRGGYWLGTADKREPYDSEVRISEDDTNRILSRWADISRFEASLKDTYIAYRPTVIDRRPIIGFHKEHQNLFVFNGLGTKGSSLAPYWAEEAVRKLEEPSIELDKTVSIGRFY